MLTTTVTPTTGQIWLAGRDVARQPIAARQTSAVVFREQVVDRAPFGRGSFIVHGRLWDSIRDTWPRGSAPLSTPSTLAKLIDRALDRYGGEQRRRLEIARGLLSLPSVPFLNEPPVGLDPRFDQSWRTSWPAFERETA
jgi:ABC-2 type transport system ATP-binding protein